MASRPDILSSSFIHLGLFFANIYRSSVFYISYTYIVDYIPAIL